MIGVLVCGWPRVRCGGVLAAGRSHRQCVRTSTHPVGVFHAVTMVFVPGSYWRAAGTLMPERAEPEHPGLAVEQGTEHAGRVECGTHSQSIARPAAINAPV